MDLTEGVIGSAFEVANVLGSGFLEKVYERALIRELLLRGLNAVCYKGQHVGEYAADLVVEKLIAELKCVEHFANEHMALAANRGAMYQLLEGLRPSGGAAPQLPKT